MIDMQEKVIEKNITPFYLKVPSRVYFNTILYSISETQTWPLEQIEKIHV